MDWKALMPRNGWLDEYIKFCQKGTDAPWPYHLFGGLGLLGLCVARDAWISWGHDRLYGNLNVCNIGRSTWPHKSTTLRIPKRLALTFDENRVYSDRFTPEALLQEIGRNPTLGIFVDEFGEFMGAVDGKEYMAGTKGDLAELYGCPDVFRTSRSGKTFKAKDVFLSIIGCTTPEWITSRVRERDILGGLYVRFLFIPEIPKTFHYDIPPKVAESEKNKILISLKRLVEDIKGVEYDPDEESLLAFIDWKRKLEQEAIADEYEARLSPFYARMQEYCLKIAMLLEISEGHKGAIRLGKMQHSIELMNQLKQYLRHLVVEEFAQDGYATRMKKIEKLVEKYPGKDRRFYKNYSHMTAGEFKDPWESCLAEGRIRFDDEQKAFFPRESK